MAKKTKTTFQVTVEHNGSKKDFDKLFKATGYVGKVSDVKLVSTKTDELGVINEGYSVPDDLKLIRRFAKEACEDAGLKWEVPGRKPGTYQINYGFQGFYVLIGGYDCVVIPNGAWTKIKCKVRVRPRGPDDDPAPVDIKSFDLGDPELHEHLVELFKNMNRGYDVRNGED